MAKLRANTQHDSPIDRTDGKFTPKDNELLWDNNNCINFIKNSDENDSGTSLGACMALVGNETSSPATWRQAMNMPEWQRAMEREVNELEGKGAWELIPRPENIKVLPGVWNFRVKKDENGSIVKYKARWCVDGSREGFTRPPEKVFSSVAELSTIRMLLALAAKGKQAVMQADFPNAYVNADIEEDVYVCQPKGLEQRDKDGYVCKLKKALYGCPISGRRWNQTLTKALISLGFKGTSIDHCLFHRESGNIKDLLAIYVDDVLVTSSNGADGADKVLDELSKVFELKKLGKARHILGLGIHQEEKGVFLEQSAYARAVLEEVDYLDAKARGTPWDSHLVEDNDKLNCYETKMFRRILGQLAYLANGTRPDLTWAVSRLASEISSPSKGAWERIKRLLRYLNGTKELGLRYKPNEGALELETFVDSSFAADKRRGRSVTGFVTYLNGGVIIWKSRLQDTVADSPNAAEYIALYDSAKAKMGLRYLFEVIGERVEGSCTIHEDNNGARRLAMDGMGQKKCRHLPIKYHFIQELCKTKEIKIVRVSTAEQQADLLTKGSHSSKSHLFLRCKLGVVNQA